MKRSMMQAYVVRSDEAVDLYQKAFDAVLISCMFSPLMTDLIDKYGIRWCLFV